MPEEFTVVHPGCMYDHSVEDCPGCMARVIEKFIETKAPSRFSLGEVRQYEYDFESGRLLYEIADAILKIYDANLISLSAIAKSPDCEPLVAEKLPLLRSIVYELGSDPIRAYKRLISEIRHNEIIIKKVNPQLADCLGHYGKTLAKMREILESCELIRRWGKERGGREIYRKIFHPITRPSFMYTRFLPLPPAGSELLERYAVGKWKVEIYRVPGRVRKLYHLIAPEFRLDEQEYALLDAGRRYLGRHEPRPEELAEPQRFRQSIFEISKGMLRDIAKGMNMSISEERIVALADILARYTAGLGILELLLADEKIQDVLINSPIGSSPIYIMHSDHLECETNIMPSWEDGENWATRFRLQSGRPLDEANPVLDTELVVTGGRARVCAITRPLSPDGLGFALRRHRERPWTFPLFIKARMIDPFSAGLLWFIIDGARTMLVAGTRGSGKSSFLGAVMTQIMPKIRQILVEDSVTGDCKILIRKNGNVYKEEIGKIVDSQIERNGCRIGLHGHEICDNFEGIEICALQDGLVDWAKIKSFIRHRVSKEILTIRTRTGREIKVTPDHSLFGLSDECEIIPVAARELTKGSYIAVPRKLPGNENGIDKLNLLEHLEKLEGFVAGEDVKNIIKANWHEIKKEAKKLGLSKTSYCYWKTKGILPCKIAARFLKDQKPEGLSIMERRKIPAVIELDEDFLTFIGLWLGDGCYDKSSVLISATDDETRKVVHAVADKFGIRVRVHSDGCTLMLPSKVMQRVMQKVLGLEGDACTKTFPQWIWSLSDQQIACILRGLYSADGYTAAAEIGLSLASKDLLWDVQTALLRLGIISKLRQKRTYSLRISSLEAIRQFAAKIGFLQRKRTEWLEQFCSKSSTHDSTDVIPISKVTMEALTKILRLNRHDYITREFHLGRKKLATSLATLRTDGGNELLRNLHMLAYGDVFWDQISDIKVEKFEGYVYDLSVPGCENFVCENFIAHNTLELPAVALRDIGYNIERLKARSVITRIETELAAEDALRTALRLGDSALILGEVRSTEAFALFEAMRIGALANVVAGTIHGESAYGVFDRVVHDLKVPATSFKAMDIILICNTLRSPDMMHVYRRITDVVEVRKHWREDPALEGGFFPLLEYSAKDDVLKPTPTLLMGESEVLTSIANRVREWRANWPAVWDNINLRSRVLATLTDAGSAKPELLEAPSVMAAITQFHMISDEVRREVGALDSKMIYEKWQNWLKTRI